MRGTVRPDAPIELRIGGHTRRELVDSLASAGVRTNAFAEVLLADPAFDRAESRTLLVAAREVRALGLPDGGTLPEVFAAASADGFDLLPLEAGPYARLALLAQEAAPDSVLSTGRAPSAAIHVASEPISEDDEQPKGFYLRVVDGEPWLRGYRCDNAYAFPPEAVFLFASGRR